MRWLLILMVGTMFSLNPAFCQTPRIYTQPKLPPRDFLQRLGLEIGWTGKLQTTGLRDAITSMQLLPHPKGDEFLVQTRSGVVQLMDAETGDVKWLARVGLPYTMQQPAAYNEDSIFVVRQQTLYALDRKTGKNRIYTIDRNTNSPNLGFKLLATPSAQPVADEVAIFIPSDDRLTAYVMPAIEKDAKTIAAQYQENPFQPIQKDLEDLQPTFLWNNKIPGTIITTPPLLTASQVTVIGNNGSLSSFNKFRSTLLYDFETYEPVSVGMGHYDGTAYIASTDKALYALDIINQRLLWRFFPGDLALETPRVNEKDIFLVTKQYGLARIDRDSGKKMWQNRHAMKFLSVNKDLVFAMSQRSELMVLDYRNGKTLGKLDLSDWTVHMSNIYTDRIYLAAHNGKILCLHSRRDSQPYRSIPFPKKKDDETKVQTGS